MKKIVTLFLVFTTISFYSQTFQGKIIDSKSNEPIEKVTLYLVESNLTTTSDENGLFSFSNIGNGQFNLKIVCVGYSSIVEKVKYKSNDNSVIEFKLEKTTLLLNEIVVTSAFINKQDENTYEIDVVNKNEMYKTGGMTVMDIIKKAPGVEAVSTGPLVSRPIIRGLSGNRVLTVVDGIRYETQQWDDEHGIGVNELGLEKVEIIKGPSSLLYGPEAMGGVINFINEQPVANGRIKGDVVARVFNNNYGANVNANIAGATDKFNWGVNALTRNLSDYFIKNNTVRIPNTRITEFGGKGYFGTHGKWGSTTLNYLYNKAFYGILDGKDITFDANGNLVNNDLGEHEKHPLEVEAPFHEVTDFRINSNTTFVFNNSKVVSVIGYESNQRIENEELAGVKKGYKYLDLKLNSVNYDVKWYLPSFKNFTTIVGSQGMFQDNKNVEDATTKLIPDAKIIDFGLLALTKYTKNDFTFSIGGRYDTRNLDATVNNNSVKKNYDNISTSVGASYNINNKLLLRTSFATGYRSPNLNELFSNGVKLETKRYERGDSNFKKETNRQFDLNLSYNQKQISLEGAVFSNSIDNYISINNTGTIVISNIDSSVLVPLYVYQQSDATITGGEAGIDIHPSAVKWFHLESKFSTLTAKRKDDKSYISRMPANKLDNTLFLSLDKLGIFSEAFFNINSISVFNQSKVALNEKETPFYNLVNLSLGAKYRKFDYFLNVRNVFDKTYLDHLSRYRDYNIYSPGRGISLGAKYSF